MDSRPQFKDPELAKGLLKRIRELAKDLPEVRIMEVCGTHTMAIGQLGLRALLPENIRLLSGPGCPVCVTPGNVLDAAIDYALKPDHIMVSFGDMLRVPGTKGTLEKAKAEGGQVSIATSPLSVIELAEKHPDMTCVFAAVGFETTIPTVARTVEIAREKGLKNVSMLVAHRLLPPALTTLCSDPDIALSGFLLPGHVSAILGIDIYENLGVLTVPSAITGFEALDILGGIHAVLDKLAKNESGIMNMYPRVVKPEGNPQARALIERVYEPVDAAWRGLGTMPLSGLALKEEFREFDAPVTCDNAEDLPKGCSCGSVLKGMITPSGCPLFGTACTPQHPVGPCMVSSEGSCAAYYRYERN